MTNTTLCSVSDCSKAAKTRGMCGMHAERVRNWGTTDGRPGHNRIDPVARFWAKVDKRGATECWPWVGTVLQNGYGQFTTEGERRGVHRYSYEINVGPIPDGMTIDHVKDRGCVRTDCVNPAHLEVVTLMENVWRSDAWSAVNRRKTHCLRGHEFDTVRPQPNGVVWRGCSTCERIRKGRAVDA